MATDQVNISQELKTAIFEAVKGMGFEVSLDQIKVEHPAEERFGDYASNIAMAIFSEIKDQRSKRHLKTQK